MIPAKAYLNELMGYDPDGDANVPETESFNTAGMSIMLVDDSQDLLDFLKEAMAQDFAEIITLQSGNKAYAYLSAEKMPDIIISDVNMPDGDGFRLCRKIKEDKRYSHIPVILLTARGEQQSQSDSYRVGADAFLAKPFEIETLLEQIKGMLRKREEVRERYFDTEDKTVSDYGSNEESFILRLNKVIAEHLDDPDLDQQMLCMELGMSRAALFNKMKTITGSGAKEYITKLRLEKAKSLIANSNLTIAEISEKTGFASQSYFSTAFKNYTGMTPSQYKAASKA
jgi:YesN/AraC family two-component response regulator